MKLSGSRRSALDRFAPLRTKREDVAKLRTDYPQRRGKQSAQDVGWNGGMPRAVRKPTVGHIEELVEQRTGSSGRYAHRTFADRWTKLLAAHLDYCGKL